MNKNNKIFVLLVFLLVADLNRTNKEKEKLNNFTLLYRFSFFFFLLFPLL